LPVLVRLPLSGGSHLIYEEPTTALEFNPAATLQQLMNGVQQSNGTG
jgi:hypothetical protein